MVGNRPSAITGGRRYKTMHASNTLNSIALTFPVNATLGVENNLGLSWHQKTALYGLAKAGLSSSVSDPFQGPSAWRCWVRGANQTHTSPPQTLFVNYLKVRGGSVGG